MIAVVGPVKFYCAVDGCYNYMQSDEILFCENHDTVDRDRTPLKNGYTYQDYYRMVCDARLHESMRGWTYTHTITYQQ